MGTEKQGGMSSLQVRKMIYAGLYLALSIVLPLVTGRVPEIGSRLCPMHIPVLLCGFMCGGSWGMAVGFVAPLMNSVISGMPPMFPTGVAMAFELSVYGFLTGFLHARMPRSKGMIYVTLISAMIAGRIAWGTVRFLLAGLSGTDFSWSMFIAGAVADAIPGIILHIALIPVLVMLMEKAGLSLNRPKKKSENKK